MARPPDPHTRDALLSAARDAFAERGVGAATVQEITERAGVSKGAFYLHFESKDAAVRAVVEELFERCEAILATLFDAAPAEPRAMLDYWLELDIALFEELWRSRALVRVLHGCGGPWAYLVDSFRQRMDGRTRRWIARYQELEVFRRDLDGDVVALVLRGAYDELIRAMLERGDRPPFERMLAEAQRLFARALGAPPLLAVLEGGAPSGPRLASERGSTRARRLPPRSDDRKGMSR